MELEKIKDILYKKLNVIKEIKVDNGILLYVSMSSLGKFMIPYTIICIPDSLTHFSYLYDVRCTWVKIPFDENNLSEKIDKLINQSKSFSKDMVMLSEFLKNPVETLNSFESIVTNVIINEYNGPCKEFKLLFEIYDKNNVKYILHLKHTDNVFFIECDGNKKIVIDALFDKAIYNLIKSLL